MQGNTTAATTITTKISITTMASTLKATASSSLATTVLRSSGHNNVNASIAQDDNNTSRKNNFVKRVKETMQTISEWAKDTDNKHINPICGNIENTFLSMLDPQPSNLSLNNQSTTIIGTTSISSSKSISKKGGTTETTSDTFIPDSSGYVVDSGRMQTSTNCSTGSPSKQVTSDTKKSSINHNSKRQNDLFCLAFTNISQCTPSIFLSKSRSNNRSSSTATNIQNRLLCKGIAGCTSLDDIPLREQVSSYGYDPYYERYIEAETLQMQRLASWGTYGTAETFNTDCNQSISINDSIMTATSGNNGISSSSMLGQQQQVQQRDAYDDDGNIIDSKIMEGTRKKMEKVKKLQQQQQQKLASSTTNQRTTSNSTTTQKRVVQFEYPPITSLRQCPRTDPDDISQLFFSEEELDMYEDDRRSTFTVDDVEIVAISTSLSEDNNPILNGTNSSTIPAATGTRIPGRAGRRPGTPRPTVDMTATSTTNNDNTTTTPASKRGSTSSSSSSSTNKKSSRQLPAINTGSATTTANSSEKSNHRRSTTSSSPVSIPRPGTPVASHRHGTPRPNGITTPTSFSTNQSSLIPSSSSHLDMSTHFPLSQQQQHTTIDHDTFVDNTNSNSHYNNTNETSSISSSQQSTSTSKKRDKRLLKSVQIYLRERSTGL